MNVDVEAKPLRDGVEDEPRLRLPVLRWQDHCPLADHAEDAVRDVLCGFRLVASGAPPARSMVTDRRGDNLGRLLPQ